MKRSRIYLGITLVSGERLYYRGHGWPYRSPEGRAYPLATPDQGKATRYSRKALKMLRENVYPQAVKEVGDA